MLHRPYGPRGAERWKDWNTVFQKGERSVKLQAEAQQIIRRVQAAQSVQKNWRQEIIYRAHRLMEQKETEAE